MDTLQSSGEDRQLYYEGNKERELIMERHLQLRVLREEFPEKVMQISELRRKQLCKKQGAKMFTEGKICNGSEAGKASVARV